MFKSEKGFTLVELLATIVILGIIMVVAVPNVTGIIYKNRSNTYVEDAKKLVTLAEYEIRSNNNKITRPGDKQCIAFSLEYLDNAEFEDPPNNGEYLKNDSFVIVKKESGSLVYYVQLVEKFKGKETYRGVPLVESSELNKSDATNLIGNFTKSNLTNLKSDKNSLLTYLKNFDSRFTCSNGVIAVYGGV